MAGKGRRSDEFAVTQVLVCTVRKKDKDAWEGVRICVYQPRANLTQSRETLPVTNSMRLTHSFFFAIDLVRSRSRI